MKTYFSIAVLVYLLSYWICYGAEPPVQRQAWTTNAPGAHDAFGTNCTHTNLYTLGRIYAAGPLGTNQIIIGHAAGILGSNAVGIGHEAGMMISNGNSAVVVGRGAAQYSTNAVNATIIGSWAGARSTHASNATIVGAYAGWSATNVENATLIGRSSGIYATNAPYATMVGARSGADVVNAPYATFIGYAADSSVGPSNIQRSVAIGYEAKVTNTNQFILGTGQYVGINTNAPAAQLHVNGTTFFQTDAYNRDPLKVAAWNYISGFVVNSNGLVGIGTNDPKFKLDIAGGSVRMDRSDAPLEAKATAYRCQYGSGVLLFSFAGFPSATAANRYCAIESSDAGDWRSLVLNPVPATGGNVGIGTTNPLAKLHVRNAGANTDPAIYLSNDAQTWAFQTYGTGSDEFRLMDITGSDTEATIGASKIGPVWIPGGLHSTNTAGTTIIGVNAGGTVNTNGVAVGRSAGQASLATQDGVFLGWRSGYEMFNSDGVCAIGRDTGYQATNLSGTMLVGRSAGETASNSYSSVFIGPNSGLSSYNSYESCFVGPGSGRQTTNGIRMSAIGTSAGYKAHNALLSTFLGWYSGSSSVGASNSVFIGSLAGTNTVRPNTLLIDSAAQGTNALIYGEFDNKLVKINDRLQVFAYTNGLAPPTRVAQPIGLFACLRMTTTNTVTIGASGTYYNLTNWTTVVTNGFTASALGWGGGFVTNLYAGFYRISGSVAALPGNSDMVELEVFLDGTGKEDLASFGSYDNPARVRTLPLTGSIVYIPANTGISLRIANETDTDSIAIWRASLTIGTP